MRIFPAAYPFFFGMGLALFFYAYARFYPFQKNFQFYSRLIGLSLLSWIGAKAFFLLEVSLHPHLFLYAKRLLHEQEFWLGGGLVFYGGALYLLSGFFLDPSLQWPVKKKFFNHCLPYLCWGHAVGRIGCFVSGCCFGREIIGTGFWQQIFVRHPVQLYEAALLILLGMYFYRNQKRESSLLVEYFLLYGCARYCLEYFRDEPIRGIINLAGTQVSLSQVVSLVLVSCAIILRLFSSLLFPLFARLQFFQERFPAFSKHHARPHKEQI